MGKRRASNISCKMAGAIIELLSLEHSLAAEHAMKIDLNRPQAMSDSIAK